MKKIYIIILILIAIFIGFYIFKNSSFNKNTIYSVPDTIGINPGDGMKMDLGRQGFSFSISPSGRYLLFLEKANNYPDIVDSPNTNLVLKDLYNNKIQKIKVSELMFSVDFSKDCWTIDEKFCYDRLTPTHNNYTRSYIITEPEFTYVESELMPGNTNDHIIKKFDSNYCSDCPSKNTVDSIINKISLSKGDTFLNSSNYTISKLGNLFYINEQLKTVSINIINTSTMEEKEIFSTKALSNVCFDHLAISPDETKIAFSRQTECGLWGGYLELHIFDIEKNEDINYGQIDLGLASFSWSPNSKNLYFVSYTNDKSSELKKIDLK